ncbi:hypothetical protein [Mesorhizobium sp. M0800]|uniref:P-loop ATPase, Sll1717 family n=1 Tax=Mesorhizobium sp. M0800 TaxID=2957000 RepID=UPI00333871F0
MSQSQNRLPLKKISFGKVDARYEVNTRDPADIQHFRSSFLEPAGIAVDEFKKGNQFFVHGVKGAGKTAFLRYLQLLAEEEGSFTRFTSFATEISDNERDKIYNLSGIETFEQGEIEEKRTAVDVWLIFIFRILAKLIEENRSVFTSHKNITTFCSLIRKFYDGHEGKKLLNWLTETLKTGKYKVKSKHLEADLKGSSGEEDKELPVSYIIEQAFRLLKELGWEGRKGIYIFFDELNISFSSKVTHKRDIVIIRDLIIAIDRINSFFIEEHKPIYVLAAVRSEVLNALNAPTHEVNKILTGRGQELRWFAKTAGSNWPIARLFEKKVRASEKIEKSKESADVFDAYFRRDVFGLSPQSFLIEATWCNPRDVVHLFGHAVKYATPHDMYFDGTVISRVLPEYSSSSWQEKAEELSVEYAMQEIQALKKGLMNFRRHFKVRHFETNFRMRAETDATMKMMLTKFDLNKIMEDLFRIGVLGQSSKEPDEKGNSFAQHWVYRGDNTFDPMAWLIVHKALWPELRLGRMG